MSTFTTPLQVTPLTDGHSWALTSPFQYHVGKFPSEFVIDIPQGFVTDFASVPRLLWALIPPTGKYGKAAVIHDFMYTYAIGSKALADYVFLEAMTVLQVGKVKRELMYQAVRLFGRGAYA